MEEKTYVPIAVKYYFDFNNLRPFKMIDIMQVLDNTKDADAFADGAEIALELLLDNIINMVC